MYYMEMCLGKVGYGPFGDEFNLLSYIYFVILWSVM